MTKRDEAAFHDAMDAAIDKYVKQQGRNTVALNAERDPACAGYARIPGPDACDFCVTMGAHSDFYHTRDTAGGDANHGTADDRYHPYCNCQICMVFRKGGKLVARDPDTGEPVDYDPADMIRRYEEAGRPTYSGGGHGQGRLTWKQAKGYRDRLESATTLEELYEIGAEIESSVPKSMRATGQWKSVRSTAQRMQDELKESRNVDAGLFHRGKKAEDEIRQAMESAKGIDIRPLTESELAFIPKTERTSIVEAAREANPKRNGKKDIKNCQRSAVAYIARRRGYDVVAKPSIAEFDPQAASDSPFNWTNVFEGIEAVKIAEGTAPSRIGEIEKLLDSYGDGSLCALRVVMHELPNEETLSHILIIERVGGETVYIDPMYGMIDAVGIVEMSLDYGTALMRVDGLRMTSLLYECCEVAHA